MLDMLKRLKHNAAIMNRLSKQQRIQIITALVEGNSLRATARMCDVSFNTVLKLVPHIGIACMEFQDKMLRNLSCKLIQCDEIWSFVGSKEKNTRPERKSDGWGDVWMWVAIDAETKLVPSFMVGTRGAQTAHSFMQDLASRLKNRIQLTTDGHKVYLQAVEDAFGSQIDYAMLVKMYGSDRDTEATYNPAEWVGSQSVAITGNPKAENISTSYVERQNLTMRMNMRRFTRLTNGFSKKIENHFFALCLHYMHYNFCRIHKTLRVYPCNGRWRNRPRLGYRGYRRPARTKADAA